MRGEVLERERRLSLPVAAATFLLVALFVASIGVVGSIGGGGEAESLRSVHEHGSTVTASSVLQAAAFVLLVAPLVYLFRAAQARDPRMRSQFLPLAMLGPLALAVASILSGIAANEAASEFVAGNASSSLTAKAATRECRSERGEDAGKFREEFGTGATAVPKCAAGKRADDRAENAIEDASMRTASGILQLAGTLAAAFALAYASFYAMRVGLLSRFWGSLGVALGVASVLGLFIFVLLWLVYFGLLVAGWVPGGRPPAWAAGEAVPWPTPGQRAAAQLEGGEASDVEPPAADESAVEPAEAPEGAAGGERDEGGDLPDGGAAERGGQR